MEEEERVGGEDRLEQKNRGRREAGGRRGASLRFTRSRKRCRAMWPEAPHHDPKIESTIPWSVAGCRRDDVRKNGLIATRSWTTRRRERRSPQSRGLVKALQRMQARST